MYHINRQGVYAEYANLALSGVRVQGELLAGLTAASCALGQLEYELAYARKWVSVSKEHALRAAARKHAVCSPCNQFLLLQNATDQLGGASFLRAALAWLYRYKRLFPSNNGDAREREFVTGNKTPRIVAHKCSTEASINIW
jgi:hypothetical protein